MLDFKIYQELMSCYEKDHGNQRFGEMTKQMLFEYFKHLNAIEFEKGIRLLLKYRNDYKLYSPMVFVKKLLELTPRHQIDQKKEEESLVETKECKYCGSSGIILCKKKDKRPDDNDDLYNIKFLCLCDHAKNIKTNDLIPWDKRLNEFYIPFYIYIKKYFNGDNSLYRKHLLEKTADYTQKNLNHDWEKICEVTNFKSLKCNLNDENFRKVVDKT